MSCLTFKTILIIFVTYMVPLFCQLETKTMSILQSVLYYFVYILECDWMIHIIGFIPVET